MENMKNRVIKLNEQDIERLVNKIIKEEEVDDLEWIRTSMEGRVRDLYNEMLEGHDNGAWEFSERYFPPRVFEGLIGMTEDGEEVPYQGIDNMLNMVNDLGEFTRDEWKLFFANVREYGI